MGKADLTGAVSYDAENNQKMINLRAEKVQRVANYIPDLEVRGPQKGKLLVLTWGSPYGAAYEAVSRLEGEGITVSHANVNYLNPFPKNTGDVLKNFDRVFIPELNMGQLLTLVRRNFPDVRTSFFHKVQGQPFKVTEMVDKIKEVLKQI